MNPELIALQIGRSYPPFRKELDKDHSQGKHVYENQYLRHLPNE